MFRYKILFLKFFFLGLGQIHSRVYGAESPRPLKPCLGVGARVAFALPVVVECCTLIGVQPEPPECESLENEAVQDEVFFKSFALYSCMKEDQSWSTSVAKVYKELAHILEKHIKYNCDQRYLVKKLLDVIDLPKTRNFDLIKAAIKVAELKESVDADQLIAGIKRSTQVIINQRIKDYQKFCQDQIACFGENQVDQDALIREEWRNAKVIRFGKPSLRPGQVLPLLRQGLARGLPKATG